MRGASLVESDDDDFAPPTPHNIRLIDSPPSNDNTNEPDTPSSKRGRSSSTNSSILRQRMSKKSRVDQPASTHRPKTATTTTTPGATAGPISRGATINKVAPTADGPPTSASPRPPRPSLARRRRPEQNSASQQARTSAQTHQAIVLDLASDSEGEVAAQQQSDSFAEADAGAHSPILPPEVDDFWAPSNFGGASSQLQQHRPVSAPLATHQLVCQPNASRFTQDSIASSQGSHDDDYEGIQFRQEQMCEDDVSWPLSPINDSPFAPHLSPYATIEQDFPISESLSLINSSMATTALLLDPTTQEDLLRVANSDTEEMSSRSTTVIDNCILCGKSLAHLDAARVEYHLNACLDKQSSPQERPPHHGQAVSTHENQPTLTTATENDFWTGQAPRAHDAEESVLDMEQFSSSQRVFAGANVDFLTVLTRCPICQSSWQQRASSSTSRGKAKVMGNPKARRKVEHMKRCAKTHNRPIQTLLYQLRLLKEKHERALMLGVSTVAEEDYSHALSQGTATCTELSIVDGSMSNTPAGTMAVATTPQSNRGDSNPDKPSDDNDSPLLDRRREKQRQAPPKRVSKPKPEMVRQSVVSMTDTPDDNFISDAIVTSVHVQQRQLTATNNSVARAERLAQMHMDQDDDGLQLALAMSLSEAESHSGSVTYGTGDEAGPSMSAKTMGGRRRRRRLAMGDYETSVLPVEEVKVLIQHKVLSLLFPEDAGDSPAIIGDSDGRMMVGATTPPWRPSRFRATQNHGDKVGGGGDSESDSLVESFSQLSSDARLPAACMPYPSSSLWRLSQIGGPDPEGEDPSGLSEQLSAAAIPPAKDQDIFVTRFMRQYILADRERVHAQAQARGHDPIQADANEDKDRTARISSGIQICLDEMTAAIQEAKQKALNKILKLVASEQAPGASSKLKEPRPSNPFKSSAKPGCRSNFARATFSPRKSSPWSTPQPLSPAAAFSADDEIVISDVEDPSLSPLLRYSRPPLDSNELSPCVRRLSDRLSVASLTSLQHFNKRREHSSITNNKPTSPFVVNDRDEDGNEHMNSGFLHSGSPVLEHSPIVSPVQSPEPTATAFAVTTHTTIARISPERHCSEEVILLSPPPKIFSSSQPQQQRRLHDHYQSRDSSVVLSNTSRGDESTDHGSLPPPLDLDQLLGFPLSQPVLRSAPMLEEHELSSEHMYDHSIIDLSDPRRLSLIREDQEEEEERRRRSLSSVLGLARHARGRSRSEEPMGSSSAVPRRITHPSPQPPPLPSPLPQQIQRRPNPLAGLPLLRRRPPPVETSVTTSSTVSSSRPSIGSSRSDPATDPPQAVSTGPSTPLSQQLPSSSTRSSRPLGRSVSTTQLPSSTSTLLSSSTQGPAPSPSQPQPPQTPTRNRGWRGGGGGFGGGRFGRGRGGAGVAPISAATRERADALMAQSARVMATFVDGVYLSQQSQVEDDGALGGQQEPEQPQQQMPDFEHMSMPRLRLAATSFGLRLSNKRKMVDELKEIWERMNTPAPPSSAAAPATAPATTLQGIATPLQNSSTRANTYEGSSSQQPSSLGRATIVQGYDEENGDGFLEENAMVAGPENQTLQSPLIERQYSSLHQSARVNSAIAPSTGPSFSQTATNERPTTGGRGGRGRNRGWNNDMPMQESEDGQDEDGNHYDVDGDDDDDEMDVLSPLDPDRMRMSMEDIIVPTSESQPHGNADASRPGSSLSSFSDSQTSSVSASSVLPAELDRQLYRFVTSTPDLHRQCLLYKPLDLEELWKRCQTAAIPVSRQHLRLFLDRRGIVCFIPAHSPLSSWRKTRAKQTTRGQQRGQQKERQSRSRQRTSTAARKQSSATSRQRGGRDDNGEAASMMVEDGDEDGEASNPPASQPRPRPLARRTR
ncbi:hypothetical protein DFQ27_001186 [Actinomortierella ambigua]|uniref:Structure-specific endonuclease subunit SLX4 n=1 Tax=Actinomortierella ambigua TaxID=1343610 RepID=A0A9P6QB83_9FUNG|nr:hypothetical protein DFQ27_001186 [Actinomortierella ambigua]